jgi:hypothetical protein
MRPAPNVENVAVSNSGRVRSLPQICDDLLRSIARIPFLPMAHRRDAEGDCPYYYGQKIEPPCGIDTRSRGSGHGYYFLLRKVLF